MWQIEHISETILPTGHRIFPECSKLKINIHYNFAFSWFGKPGFPECTDSYDISDYMGPDSIGLFTTLGLDLNFLEHDAESWEELETYQAALKAVKHLKVVNDAAERGVKLTAYFMGVAKKEKFQKILQMVENDRTLVSNQRKRHVRIININK